jgi:hypothetical protein
VTRLREGTMDNDRAVIRTAAIKKTYDSGEVQVEA